MYGAKWMVWTFDEEESALQDEEVRVWVFAMPSRRRAIGTLSVKLNIEDKA